ncbi:MAG: hypothetical protein AABZ10_08470 [Nitrospirota bacterium]
MKVSRFSFVIFSVSLFLLHPFTTHAVSQYGAYEPDRSFGFQEWFTSGEASWQISFPITGGRTESELNFKHIDSPITVLRGGGNLDSEWSFDASVGFGSISGGRGTDTDRDIFPTLVDVWSVSTQDISGDVRFLEINLAHWERVERNQKAPWGIGVGFLHYEDRLTITNGVQTVPVYSPISGLNSTYDFYWNALKVSALHERPLDENFSFSAAVSLYPYVNYYGEGYWNLRTGTNPTDFRLSPPSFTHKSTMGFGYEASLGFAYHFTDTAEFTAGYRYLYLKAKDGTDKVFFADGTVGIANFDWVEVTRQGAYAGFLFKF